MRLKPLQRLIKLFLLLVFFSGTFSCVDKIDTQVVVYENYFSDLNLEGFFNGRLIIFEGDTVVGFYHNEEITLSLDNLPRHNLLKVTLDILIHDTWDGNTNEPINGPDYWFFGLDNVEVFRTTFSNSPCESTFCLFQSYPDGYLKQNVPKFGAVSTNLPGLCLFGGSANYTTRYSVSKIVEHKNSTLKIFMNSDLRANVPDPVCDESWSLAGVKVEVLTVN